MAFPSGTLIADAVVKTPWAYRRNRYYFSPTTPPAGISELEAAANAVFNTYSPLYAAMLSDICWFERIECKWYGSGGSSFEASSTAEPLEGSLEPPVGAGLEDDEQVDVLPDEVSLIIQVRTGGIGRQKRGRRFITGLSEQMQSRGEISPLGKPLAKALANALSDDIGSITGVGTLHARHYNRKDNVLLPITKCYALAAVGSRIDRRKPLNIRDRL